MSTTVMPWRGFHAWDDVRKELDDAFRRVLGEAQENGNKHVVAAWSPRVDVSETDKAFMVKADLPGVDPKDVEISIREGVLTLKGEKKEVREEKKKNFHRMERFVGQFYREIPLPSGVDETNIEATTAKGVITITVPKKAEAQPKKIEVKALPE